jgi:hypothetical protein
MKRREFMTLIGMSAAWPTMAQWGQNWTPIRGVNIRSRNTGIAAFRICRASALNAHFLRWRGQGLDQCNHNRRLYYASRPKLRARFAQLLH